MKGIKLISGSSLPKPFRKFIIFISLYEQYQQTSPLAAPSRRQNRLPMRGSGDKKSSLASQSTNQNPCCTKQQKYHVLIAQDSHQMHFANQKFQSSPQQYQTNPSTVPLMQSFLKSLRTFLSHALQHCPLLQSPLSSHHVAQQHCANLPPKRVPKENSPPIDRRLLV